LPEKSLAFKSLLSRNFFLPNVQSLDAVIPTIGLCIMQGWISIAGSILGRRIVMLRCNAETARGIHLSENKFFSILGLVLVSELNEGE